MGNIDCSERLNRAAELLRSHRFHGWSYGDSIGFEGLLAAARAFSRPEFFEFAYGYLRGWAARSEPFVELDNTAPGHAACLVYEKTHDESLLQALDNYARWLISRPRIHGVFASFSRACVVTPHGPTRLSVEEVSLLNDPGPGVYLDCLHFDPPFLAHLGRLLASDELTAEAVKQAEGYIDLLHDFESGLFRHFYLAKTGRSYALGWGRGQGWAILGLLDLIEHLGPQDERRQKFVDVVRRMSAALKSFQRGDGSWYTVVQTPSSGDETSTAAFLAAAFWQGIELGVLDRDEYAEPAEAAWQAAVAQLAPSGMLQGVSAAVESSTADEHYYYVPKGFLVPWGQGPLLLAAVRRPSGIDE